MVIYIKTNDCALLTNEDNNVNRWLPVFGGRKKQGEDGKGYKLSVIK